MAASRKKPSADLLARVGEFLADRHADAGRICIGLSGGCDSVVLLHLASRLGFGERLAAIHVDHGLSPHAAAWSQFCAEYCSTLNIPLRVARVNVDCRGGLGLEAAARQARYLVLADCQADVLLLAHHQGDLAETVLFNVLRGSGVTGARGMPIERGLGKGVRLLRPLLGVSRAELEAYAKDFDLRWVDDESNGDTRFSRNFLRHEVLPLLTQRFPAAEASLALAGKHFAEADELLSDLASIDWQNAVDDGPECSVPLAALRQLSLSRLKNLLRFRLRQVGWRAPVAPRLEEFARQVFTAAPDRHPELRLPDGVMRLVRGRLYWLPLK